MMDFAHVTDITIPNGSVAQITDGTGRVIWKNYDFLYVSMGDSIAAGHTINADWETDYGERSQYGKNGNLSTAIVPNCYTDRLRSDLAQRVDGKAVTVSFARSGDTVADLIAKLSQTPVINAVKRANMMTICIGANDILQTAMNQLDEYIATGSLANIEASVEANLAVLADDSNANSYKALLDRLTELNPMATIVFTTVYNPYKYLWLEEGHHGFFKPLMDMIPDMEVAGVDFDSFIKDSLLGTPIVQQLFDRVNGLGDWVEVYVTRLNNVLKQKVSAYQSTNPNIKVADTKAVFDGVPDREITAEKHYNDLVSVEFTRGYDYTQINWGAMWGGTADGASDYFWGLANTYGIDISAIAEVLVNDVVNEVIVPDVDPHPEPYGHYVLKRSFADALGWQSLDRYTITYNANGGSGTMAAQTVLGVDGLAAYAAIAANAFTPGAEGYYCTGWADGNGTAYTAGQWVGFTADLTLNAQWSNIYYIRYDAYSDSALLGDDDTGKMDYYALAIGGEIKDKFGKFSNPSIYYQVPYGTEIIVAANDSAKNKQSYVSWNGERVTEKSNFATYTFTLTGNVRIRFEANKYYSGITLHEYWICLITTL